MLIVVTSVGAGKLGEGRVVLLDLDYSAVVPDGSSSRESWHDEQKSQEGTSIKAAACDNLVSRYPQAGLKGACSRLDSHRRWPRISPDIF